MLWGEIKVDFDDLKHIDHHNRGFIELYNTIMTYLGDLGLLLAVPANPAHWCGSEGGTIYVRPMHAAISYQRW